MKRKFPIGSQWILSGGPDDEIHTIIEYMLLENSILFLITKYNETRHEWLATVFDWIAEPIA